MRHLMILILCTCLCLAASCASKEPTKPPTPVEPPKPVVDTIPLTTGTLMVRTNPSGGQVRVLEVGKVLEDGGIIELTPSIYNLEAQSPSYPSILKKVTIKAGELKQVIIDFESELSLLKIDTDPEGGEVYVDWLGLGPAPCSTSILPGTHVVEVEWKGYPRQTQKVEISGPVHSLLVKREGSEPVPLDNAPPRSKRSDFQKKEDKQSKPRDIKSQVVKPITPVQTPVAPLPPTPLVAPQMGTLKVSSRPDGALVFIKAVKSDSTSFKEYGTTPLNKELETGKYKVRVELKNYPEQTRIVAVSNNQITGLEFFLDLAQMEITSLPAGAEVLVDGELKGHTPLTLDLQSGLYKLLVRKDGFLPNQRSVLLKPGLKTRIEEFSLKPEPISGPVLITADHTDTVLFLNDKKVGTQKASLDAVNFNKYEVRAERKTGPFTRLIGVAQVEHSNPEGAKVNITANVNQRIYKGKWVAEKEALSMEETSYRRQRAKWGQVNFTLKLTPDAAEKWRGIADLAKSLHSLLQIGDQLKVAIAGQEWVFWKRSRTMQPEFKHMVDQFSAGKTWELPWKKDGQPTSSGESLGLPEAIRAIYLLRSKFPMLNLSKAQLPPNKINIARTSSDGQIFIVVSGGKSVEVKGRRVSAALGLTLAAVDPGNGNLTLHWRSKPEHVTVVCSGASPYGRLWVLVTPRSDNKRATALDFMDEPRSACMVNCPGSICCLEHDWLIRRLARPALSRWASIHPTTKRLKISIMTYR